MTKACPVSGERRDEHAVRTVAACVVVIVAASITVRGPIAGATLFALAVDFAVRAFGQPRFSPLAWVAKSAVRLASLTPKLVDAAPKRFAAKIGLGFSAIAGALYLAQQPVPATIVAGVLVFCAFLESAFGVCIGCKVYALLPRRG